MTEKEPGTRDPAIDLHIEMLKRGSWGESSYGCYDPLEDIDDIPPNPAAKGRVIFTLDDEGRPTVRFEDGEE